MDEISIGFSLDPFDQPIKKYSELGVAVIVTLEFWLYVPPIISTLPPSAVETAKVNVVIAGVTSPPVESSSLEQENRIRKNKIATLLIIWLLWNYKILKTFYSIS